MNEIEKSFTPTIWMFFRASRDIFHATTSAKLLYGFFLGMPLLLLGLWSYNGTSLYAIGKYGLLTNWSVLALCVGYVLVFIPTLHYWNIQKKMKTNQTANQTQNYFLSSNGLRNFGDEFDTTIQWPKINKIRKSKAFLFFYISDSDAYFIPIGLLSPTEIDQIFLWSKSNS